jgi:glycosyltransferase involved in cell wall biosynthesis
MRAAGHEVVVAAPCLLCDSATQSWLAARGVVCIDVSLSRAGLNPLRDMAAIFEFYWLMRRTKPDLVFSYTAKPVIWGLVGAFLASVPQRVALITGLGYAFTDNPGGFRAIVKALVRILYWFALRSATLIFFQNPDDRADFKRMGLLPSSLPVLLVAGSGIDLDQFPKQPLPLGPLRFLLIARLVADKGIREYVAAARILRRHFPEVIFHLAGGSDPNPAGISEAEMKSWHSAGDVICHGHLEDVRPILAQTHVYVLPSYREGTPRTVLEAMATGRPIITTDAPGCRETVIHGFNGLLVSPRDVQDLVLAMRSLIEQPRSETERMAQASLELVRRRFDVLKVNAQMLAAMQL